MCPSPRILTTRGKGNRAMRNARSRTRVRTIEGADSGDASLPVSASEARDTVVAPQERRARPPLAAPMGFTSTETNSGLALSALSQIGGAAGTAFGLFGSWSTVPHSIRSTRYFARSARISNQLVRATERSQPGSAEVKRVTAFRRAIVEGSTSTAACGVFQLFMELAGEDAVGKELVEKRSPVWPACTYLRAATTQAKGAWTAPGTI